MMYYFLSYLAIIIIQIILLLAFINLSKNNIKINSKLILVILGYSVIEVFLSLFVSIPINGVICLLYFLVIMKIFGKMDFREIIFYIVVLWIFGIVLDISIMLGVNGLRSIIPQLNVGHDYIKPFASIIMVGCLLLISKNNHIQYVTELIYKRIKNLNITSLKLVFLLILYLILDAICIININNRYMIIIFLSVTILITYIIKNKYEIANLKITNKLLIKNNNFSLKIINDYRILKHNLINQLLGLKSVANSKAKVIIDDLMNEYDKSFKVTQNVNDIPSGLGGIVLEKIYNSDCDDLNILIDNKLDGDIFDYITPRKYNLICEALGIALDNALESTIKSDEKILYLRFIEDSNDFIITLANSFKGELDLEALGNINYTSKENGHGYGLFTIFEKRKLNVKTWIKNNLFIIEIKVNKKRK